MRRRQLILTAAAIFSTNALAARSTTRAGSFEVLVPAPGIEDHMPAIRAAYERARKRKVPLLLQGGDFKWGNPSEESALRLESNSTVIFAEDARLVWGGEGKYFCPLVMIGVTDVKIVDPKFLWTGRLTVGHDFYVADPSFGFIPEHRYGTKFAYAPYLYCTAILALESERISISGLRGRSVAGDGQSVIHSWIFAARTHDLHVSDLEAYDCVSAVLTQGGRGGVFENLVADRLSQDVGIPGHVLYTFMDHVQIRNIRDGGAETSLSGKISSHSVSYGGGGPATISGIVSKRLAGPLNIKNAKNGCEVENINWRPLIPPHSKKIDNPAIYLVVGTGNRNIRMRDIQLDAAGIDLWLVGGDITDSEIEAVLVRDDNAPPVTGYMLLQGSGGLIRSTLFQRGVANTPIVIGRKNPLIDCKLKLNLNGFADPPTLDARAEAGSFSGNQLEYSGVKSRRPANAIFVGASVETLKSNTIVAID